jgi:phenylalanyl-tRNA synthetase beta chain|nr:phenylalanine--tRNA ligase subunit beta [Kofleriaceae bacterium]
MKVVWSWLLELCDLDRQPTVEEGAAALTRGGMEIEGVTNLGAGFSGVVVAEVVAKRPHPSSDKLTLVDVVVDSGGAPTQVVCGAPNVPDPGRRVLWARVGATLPGGITLADKPVKGIVSPGMLCAEDELGLGESHAGIVVLDADDPTPLGAPAQRALGVDDFVLELNAPANRGDVLGLLGVARELCAMLGGRVVLPNTDLTEFASAGTADGRGGVVIESPGSAGARSTADGRGGVVIDVQDAAQCPRYTARVIDGLTIGPSPRRIAARLRAVGVRPISNLVDVTNYVMFELGQPLHAFDAATLTAGVITIGSARDGEQLATLDGSTRTLVAGDLVIRDGARAIALAGVMGGLDSEVRDGTTRVLLEAASFRANSVRRTARRLGLHSESSHRFERGVDPELAELASRRAARLLCELAGGKVLQDATDAYPGKRAVAPITVRLARVRALTGVPSLDAAACTAALTKLGCAVAPAAHDALAVTPPSARADVTREVDVIEEILRVHGYDHVSTSLPAMRVAPPLQDVDRADRARRALAATGASEAITFAFQSVDRCSALGVPATDRRAQPIAIRNPMSADQAVMRTSLLPNLLAAVARNASFGRADVDLFEIGSVFLRRGEAVVERPPSELADEPRWAAGVLSGRRPAGIGAGAPYDAFDAKARAIVAIRAVAGDLPIDVAAAAVPYLHPGVAGELRVDRDGEPRIVGWFGEVHPDVRKRLGVDAPAFCYEVDLEALHVAPPAQMRPIPRFPGSARDVSLLLAAAIPAGRIEAAIAGAREPLVTGVRLLEDYRDAKLGDGMKSMLWSIHYRAGDRTLTIDEVDKAHEAIVARLISELPAQRR